MGGGGSAPAVSVPTATETVISGKGSTRHFDQYFKKIGGEEEAKKKARMKGAQPEGYSNPLTTPGVSTTL
jgi:hypothetical protein